MNDYPIPGIPAEPQQLPSDMLSENPGSTLPQTPPSNAQELHSEMPVKTANNSIPQSAENTVQSNAFTQPNTPPVNYAQQQYSQQQGYQYPPQYRQAFSAYPQPEAHVPYGASVSGVANAYPSYYFRQSPEDSEREKIRSASSAGGKLTIAIFITMLVVGIIIAVTSFFTGVVRETPKMGDDPYMGFTPMGFYIYEGLTSLVAVFIPSLIIMNSIRKSEHMSYDDFLPFKPLGGKKLAATVFGGMAICMLAQIMAVLLSFNFSMFGIDVDEAVSMTYGTGVIDVIMNSICTAFIPALVEEFAYRGVVLGALKKYDVRLAIVGSAFLFGMLHGNLAQIPFAFVVGLVLAYVRVKTDSMLPNILIHFGNNFYAVIISTINEIAPDSVTTLIDAAVMTVLLVAGFICIYYLSKNDRNFFSLETSPSYLTFGAKMKTFFTTGTVIACTIVLLIETVAMLEFI